LILPDLEITVKSLLIENENNNAEIQNYLISYNKTCIEEKKEDDIKVVNTQPSEDVLIEELESVKELLELEPDSKCK